jgi:DNA polymerase-3 subunit delta'
MKKPEPAPVTLQPILGHAQPMRVLWDAFAADRLHHAWLLEGPDGVGRRTLAMRFILATNCEAGKPDPCGVCASCRRILAGQHPDVLVIEPEGATIPVARIRELVRQAGYHRHDAKIRFILIDPAEALAPAAANALLKTLEEPNPGTCFLLIARHASGLLPTIVSRCQRLRLAPVPHDLLVAWLRERGAAEPELAARLSGGCPGAALRWSEGGLAERVQLRADLLDALGGDLEAIFKADERLAEGKRAASRATLEAALDLLEDLLRDAVAWSTGHRDDLMHADLPHVVEAWATALWPGGVTVCQRIVLEARRDLEANVSPRSAFDAMMTSLATELGTARKAGVGSPRPAAP